MRPGPNKRSRGRNNGGGNPNQHNGGRPRQNQRSQNFESNGPGIKIRGNAYQVFERYVTLAREAASAGDRVAAENFYQHAEHYFRILNAAGENPLHMQQRMAIQADLDAEQAENDSEEQAEAELEAANQSANEEPASA